MNKKMAVTEDGHFFIQLFRQLFHIFQVLIGFLFSSNVNPSPATSCTELIATNAWGSMVLITFFKRTISFLPTTQYKTSRLSFVKLPLPANTVTPRSLSTFIYSAISSLLPEIILARRAA